jgi:hypothetical protein
MSLRYLIIVYDSFFQLIAHIVVTVGTILDALCHYARPDRTGIIYQFWIFTRYTTIAGYFLWRDSETEVRMPAIAQYLPLVIFFDVGAIRQT